MFDRLLREMERIERGVQVPIQVHLDDDGQLDRRCPSRVCQADFKVLLEDWKAKVRDEVAYCPICRYESKGTDWNTSAQREYMRKAALAHVQEVVRVHCTRTAAGSMPSNRGAGSSNSHCPTVPVLRSS